MRDSAGNFSHFASRRKSGNFDAQRGSSFDRPETRIKLRIITRIRVANPGPARGLVIKGAEVTDYRLTGRDVVSGEKRGCALSNEHF
jgi:hypothetical protein